MKFRPRGWPSHWPEDPGPWDAAPEDWPDASCLPPWWLSLSLAVLIVLILYGGARVLMWVLR